MAGRNTGCHDFTSARSVVRSMERFGLGTQMRLLNRVFAPADYRKFEAMASFMGASKTALSIRMTQLGLLKGK